ncbi:hypothetical protein BDD12DRAFT_848067 [Trichophaea hybrida]|nr:hypothetical protein BDD12DRAFT_848067 [Trichophaea hybrida]
MILASPATTATATCLSGANALVTHGKYTSKSSLSWPWQSSFDVSDLRGIQRLCCTQVELSRYFSSWDLWELVLGTRHDRARACE